MLAPLAFRVKITEIDLPERGLKARVLKELSKRDAYNFQFVGGVKIQFRDLSFKVWTFVPPSSYTDWELEITAQQVFDKWARKKGKKSPKITSVGIEGRAMLVIEAIGQEKGNG